MKPDNEIHSVTVICKDSKISQLIMTMLPQVMFNVTLIEDSNEARRRRMDLRSEIYIVDSGDGKDADLAEDFCDSSSVTLLLVPNHLFDQISYRFETRGIICVSKPLDNYMFYAMIKAALAMTYKIHELSAQTFRLKEKMEEIRIVNRAKMVLMQSLSMSEAEAHRYIEKEAMDRCIKKLSVAENVLRTYEK